MPINELRTYQPVCDECGKVGSIWTHLTEQERTKAVPPGWRVNMNFRASDHWITTIICDECVAREEEVRDE